MSGTTLPASLQRPSGYLIPRLVDQLSYCYMEMARIVQDDTGVAARIDTEQGPRVCYLPTAAIASLLLGPGTSITRDAIITLTRHGTHVSFVGSGGIRCHNTMTGASDTRLLLKLAAIVSDPEQHLAAAQLLYRKRFPMSLPKGVTLQQLRGLEGTRMRALYQEHAKRRHIKFKRQYTPGDFSASDAVNQALTAGNTALYGIVNAALASLGIHPGLGIVHTGHAQSLTYDIADLYKADITIPLAFDLSDSSNPERDVRRQLRNRLTLLKLLPRIVADIYELCGEGPAQVLEMTTPTMLLWDEDAQALPTGTNYA